MKTGAESTDANNRNENDQFESQNLSMTYGPNAISRLREKKSKSTLQQYALQNGHTIQEESLGSKLDFKQRKISQMIISLSSESVTIFLRLLMIDQTY